MILKLVTYKQADKQDGGYPPFLEEHQETYYEGDEIKVWKNDRDDYVGGDGQPVKRIGYRIIIWRNNEETHNMFLEPVDPEGHRYVGYIINDHGKTASKPIDSRNFEPEDNKDVVPA